MAAPPITYFMALSPFGLVTTRPLVQQRVRRLPVARQVQPDALLVLRGPQAHDGVHGLEQDPGGGERPDDGDAGGLELDPELGGVAVEETVGAGRVHGLR